MKRGRPKDPNKEKWNPSTSGFIYCMYCEANIRKMHAFKANGAYDVCKDEKCIDKYFKSRKAELNRTKKKEVIDIGWMCGD